MEDHLVDDHGITTTTEDAAHYVKRDKSYLGEGFGDYM